MEPYASDSGSTSGPQNEFTTATGTGPGSSGRTRPVARRKAARYAVPAAVAGVAALTVGLVPALADSGDPDLPDITAQKLVEKIAASDTEQLSGTFKISTDLGLPTLGGASIVPGGSGGGSSSADPQAKLTELASGTHTLRIAADGPDRQKLSLLENAAEYSLVHNGDEAWAYDSGSNQAVRFAVPKDGPGRGGAGQHAEGLPKGLPTTPEELAAQTLKAVDDTTSVSVDGTARVAGRDTYQLLVRPRQSGSTIESARIAVDAKTGTPLKFTLNAVGGGKPVVSAGFTRVDFAKPAASTFDFSPPKGAKVTEGDSLDSGTPGKRVAPKNEARPEGVKVIGKGWGAVAELSLPGGQGLPQPGSGEVPPEAEQLLGSLGKQVKGSFGTGTVFSTRLVNALITDDGKVYAGAVDKDALVRAAESAE